MTNRSPLLRAIIAHRRVRTLYSLPSLEEAEADVEALLASFRLHGIRRYFNQTYWREESKEAAFSDRAEPGLKLENVAAHSWHVADAVLLIGPHFPIDHSKALSLAILHDKLEMYTGDYDPVGPDGQGTFSHAFHSQSQQRKIQAEENALESYLSGLRETVRASQRLLLMDIIHGSSSEASFVKSIDKLQAMAFVYAKKAGNISDDHLIFSIRYSRKSIEYFSGIQNHYLALLDRILNSVASYRSIDRTVLDDSLFSQYEFDLR